LPLRKGQAEDLSDKSPGKAEDSTRVLQNTEAHEGRRTKEKRRQKTILGTVNMKAERGGKERERRTSKKVGGKNPGRLERVGKRKKLLCGCPRAQTKCKKNFGLSHLEGKHGVVVRKNDEERKKDRFMRREEV